MSTTQTATASAEERLSALDLIRGVAVLGILAANLPIFCGPVDTFSGHSLSQSLADRAVSAVVLFLISMKFVTMLSILFGVGLGLQFDRASARGDTGFPIYYLWRQCLLLVLGACHGLLLWWGDILTVYAITGSIALLVALAGPLWVRWGSAGGLAWTYLATLAILIAAGVRGDFITAMQAPAGLLSEEGEPVSILFGEGPLKDRLEQYFTPENQVRIHRHGHFGHLLENRAFFYLTSLLTMPFLFGWYILGCFLLGISLLRAGLFHDPGKQQSLTRWFVVLGLGVGVPCHVAAVAFELIRPNAAVSFTMNILGALPQALLYLALLLAWDRSGRLPRLQARLRAVGRMALTNYLAQSALCGLVFYGYGLGLYGRTGLAPALLVMLAVWLLELAWSPPWLRRFGIGPVEWAWRRLAAVLHS